MRNKDFDSIIIDHFKDFKKITKSSLDKPSSFRFLSLLILLFSSSEELFKALDAE